MGTKTREIYATAWPFTTVNNQTTGAVQPSPTYHMVRSRTGVSNPYWRQQVKDNVSATTTFIGTAHYLEFKDGTTDASRPRGWAIPQPPYFLDIVEKGSGCWPAGLAFGNMPSAQGGMDVTTSRNIALNRLHKAIRAQSTHFSGGTFLGELKESLGTIRSVTRLIANRIPQHLAAQQKLTKRYVGSYVVGPNGSAVRVKDFNPRKGKRLPASKWKELQEKLSDAWLEFAFGIRPLVRDVHDAAEALARFKFDNKHEHVRGYGNYDDVYSRQVGQTGAVGLITNGVYTDNRTFRQIVVFRAGLQFSVDSPAFGSAGRLQSLLGFRLQDFVPTVWNLLPYSFLVDYFVNVGDCLNALTTDTSSVRWVCESTVRSHLREIVAKASLIPGFNPPGDGVGGSMGSAKWETRTVNRGVSAVDIPRPEIKIPGLTNDRGEFNQQLLNMLALVTGGKGARRGF